MHASNLTHFWVKQLKLTFQLNDTARIILI